MRTETKLLIYLLLLALVDMLIPIPFTAILLVYVLLEKPKWFEDIYKHVYKQ